MELISTTLGLSRCCELFLTQTQAAGTEESFPGILLGIGPDTFSRTKNFEKNENEILTIIEGSSLKFMFPSCFGRKIRVASSIASNLIDNSNNTVVSGSDVMVTIHAESSVSNGNRRPDTDIFSISQPENRNFNGGVPFLQLHCLTAGKLWLKASATAVTDVLLSSNGLEYDPSVSTRSSLQNTLTCDVEVTIISSPLDNKCIEVQELAALAEISFTTESFVFTTAKAFGTMFSSGDTFDAHDTRCIDGLLSELHSDALEAGNTCKRLQEDWGALVDKLQL